MSVLLTLGGQLTVNQTGLTLTHNDPTTAAVRVLAAT